jgi:hypothetical protein
VSVVNVGPHHRHQQSNATDSQIVQSRTAEIIAYTFMDMVKGPIARVGHLVVQSSAAANSRHCISSSNYNHSKSVHNELKKPYSCQEKLWKQKTPIELFTSHSSSSVECNSIRVPSQALSPDL